MILRNSINLYKLLLHFFRNQAMQQILGSQGAIESRGGESIYEDVLALNSNLGGAIGVQSVD